MSTQMLNSIQIELVKAIETFAPPAVISALLLAGADPNDMDFIQALEGVSDASKTGWLASVEALPAVAEALSWRATLDQTAFDLVDAIESNDFENAQASLETLLSGDEDANFDMGDGSMLALSVMHRNDIAIIELLLGVGRADLNDFSKDAFEALEEAEEGAWKAEVEKLFNIRVKK